MARRTKKEMQEKEDLQLLDECIDHQAQSAKMLETVSSTWDEKEAMLIGKLEDSLSKKAKSKISQWNCATRTACIVTGKQIGRAHV